ncbi:unnamed protein product [Coregonus sp. 'balchen']|nr:unnamed protein product [Coregonus sp. 'balchen']
MSLVCAISNEVPEHPCVSPVSNQVFERRLIEKYIAENGADPMNGQPLSEEQLIDIKVSHPIRPKAPSSTSIPAILKALQDEWDAVMLHSFTLRQQLQTTPLATLKPQAGLVVAQAVTSQPSVTAGGAGEPMEVSEQVGMNPEIIQKLQDKATVLTTERKKRGKTVPEELVRTEDLSKYRQVATHAVSGADKNVVVFDKKEEQIIATLKGHTKKVTSVIYHPSQSVVFSASPDSTIRVWSVTGGNCVQVVRAHEASVTGLSLHATGDYLLSSSEDQVTHTCIYMHTHTHTRAHRHTHTRNTYTHSETHTWIWTVLLCKKKFFLSLHQYWAFSDIQTGRVLTKVTDEAAGCALTCAQFHPDGLIFGTGTADSQIKIWDLKERTNVANFPGHTGPVTSIAFSENGYYLATGENAVKSLVFDQSGTYLAVGGTDIRVYICKQWSEVLNFTEHTGVVTGVAFGEHAQFLTSTGMDRSLKFYSL